MNAEQEIRFVIGDAIVQAVTLRHHLNAANTRIAELEAELAELKKPAASE